MIFVTGGTGLVGSHLLFELSSSNEYIKAVYRDEKRIDIVKSVFQHYDPESWEDRFQKIRWIQGDILNISFLMENIEEGDVVYHCAAKVSFDPSKFHELNKINREGTTNIVNAALGKNAATLCYVSSTAAIGGEDHVLITEETKWKKTPTTSAYSVSKYGAEKEVWRGIEEGLSAVIVNPCVILGPGSWNDSSLTIFKTLKSGQYFYPPGKNATVDARDVARIMVRLVDEGIRSERFLLIGSNQPIRELMTVIASKLDKKAPKKEINKTIANFARTTVEFVSFFTRKRPSITKDSLNSLFGHKEFSNEKIRKALNYTFYSLEEQVDNAVKGRVQSKNS